MPISDESTGHILASEQRFRGGRGRLEEVERDLCAVREGCRMY